MQLSSIVRIAGAEGDAACSLPSSPPGACLALCHCSDLAGARDGARHSPTPTPALPSSLPQAQYLRELNRGGQHDAVIQLFESDRLVATEEIFGQYVKALAKADKLNGTALMQTLYRGAQSYLGAGGAAQAAAPYAAARAAAAEAPAAGSFAASGLRPTFGLGGAAEPAAAALGGAAGMMGSAKNPVRLRGPLQAGCWGVDGPACSASGTAVLLLRGIR